MDAEVQFYKQKHVKFFSRCLDVLPNAYQRLDTNRMTVRRCALGLEGRIVRSFPLTHSFIHLVIHLFSHPLTRTHLEAH